MSATADTRPPPPEQISFNAWKTILILSGTIVIFLYLNTAMSPALPSIAQDFQISDALASWVMTAYMVCGAVMTVIMGRLADLIGAKKMLMIMMICFTVGTILAPFSPNISTLLALRVLQGIAVASTPISTKLIRDQVPKTKFPIGLSIYLVGLFWRHGTGGCARTYCCLQAQDGRVISISLLLLQLFCYLYAGGSFIQMRVKRYMSMMIT